MRSLLLTLLLSFIVIEVFSQKWVVTTKETIDGVYKTASVQTNDFIDGRRISFVVKHGPKYGWQMSILNVGCDICFNKRIRARFDNDNHIYDIHFGTSNGDWHFIWGFYNIQELDELLTKLKSHNNLFIQVSSDAGSHDITIPLKGSKAALDYLSEATNKAADAFNSMDL